MLVFALYYFFEPQNREIIQRVFSEIYFFSQKRVLVFFFLIADLVIADGGEGDQSNIPEPELVLTRSSQSHHESYGIGVRFEGSYEV